MSNPENPWFRFYVREWLTDVRVRGMSLAARGAYIDLLCYQWENGTVPEDLGAVARLIGATVAELEQVWPQLADRFPPVRGGGLQNPRLEKERIQSRRRRDSATTAGRASAASRQKRAVRTAQNDTSYETPFNGSPTIQDGDGDGDEEEDEEKIADARPSAPAPPISNPGPPKSPESRESRIPSDRIRWDEFIGRWNELAAAEDLPKIGGALSDGRKRKARAVMAAMRRRGLDWFDVVAGAVRDRRGAWARGMRFPTLDQACREEIVDKLAEGFYERDRQTSSGQPEHLNRQSDFKPTRGPTRIKIIRPEERSR